MHVSKGQIGDMASAFLTTEEFATEATKRKSPERSGLQLDVFWEAALPLVRREPLKYACLQKLRP